MKHDRKSAVSDHFSAVMGVTSAGMTTEGRVDRML